MAMLRGLASLTRLPHASAWLCGGSAELLHHATSRPTAPFPFLVCQRQSHCFTLVLCRLASLESTRMHIDSLDYCFLAQETRKLIWWAACMLLSAQGVEQHTAQASARVFTKLCSVISSAAGSGWWAACVFLSCSRCGTAHCEGQCTGA